MINVNLVNNNQSIKSKMKWFYLFATVITLQLQEASSDLDPKKSDSNNQKLPPCQACKTLYASFEHGLKKTSRGKFEGGDAAWEEQKMGSYATSEVRLIEILENLCSEVDRGKFQCQGLAEENEAFLEEWWKNQDQLNDLFNWLCIDKLKVCCPELHYGKNCTPCSGYPDNVCNNNGKCKGSGTRKGNGQCSCNIGYEGSFCNKCSDSYYVSYQDNDKLLCSPCHHSCQNTCTQAGPKGCVACKNGWYMNTEHGCLDINECITKVDACNINEFCINNDGSFTCLKCDKACKSCHGDGPDMCEQCAEGYYLKDKFCVDEQTIARENHVSFTRYITYLGLCVATCIIFQKNTLVASVIGLCIAVYISISEYMLSNEKSSGVSDFSFKNVFKTV